MPCISVIVPVYQAEKLIQDCVKSVQQQTFQDWELLLIDDGSRDTSPALCDGFAAHDDRIRVFHKPNGGVSSARNLGLQEAKGDYIAFLDADDQYEPQALETMWSLMQQAGADSAACANLNLWGSSQSVELCLPAGIYEGQALRDKIVYPLLGDRLVPPLFNGFVWRYLFSAAIIREHHISFEGAYLEDDLFLMEYFCIAKKLAVTEDPLYRYFWNPASATHRYMKDFLTVFGRFMERKEELVQRFALNDARPQWRENTNWSGLLIAIGNEYAKGNPKTLKEKQKAVEALCASPDMARAIAAITPAGLGTNKQMVANLVVKKHFSLLSLLYRLKNRN